MKGFEVDSEVVDSIMNPRDVHSLIPGACDMLPDLEKGTSSCLLTKSCPALCNPMDCSLPGSSVNGISQSRILE